MVHGWLANFWIEEYIFKLFSSFAILVLFLLRSGFCGIYSSLWRYPGREEARVDLSRCHGLENAPFMRIGNFFFFSFSSRAPPP